VSQAAILVHCSQCGHSEPMGRSLSGCPACGCPVLDARYQFEGLQDWTQIMASRPFDMWRYRELLPLREERNIVSMGEGGTPLLESANLAAMLGLRHLYIKDERQGPTGSFKDRQASLAISVMRENDIKEAVVASTGNVAIAYAAYCARASIKLWAFITSLVPAEKMREIALYGAEVIKVTGTYDHTKQVAARFAESKGLHLDRGIKTIAAKESMKTVAFEIAEQLGERSGHADGFPWRVPDWYLQAVSGGLGPVGVMKGFRELNQHRLVHGMPRLGIIQAAGCDPIVRAHQANQDEATPIHAPQTLIATIATGDPGPAYRLIRDDVLKHGGAMVSVSDDDAFRAIKTVAQLDGISVEPAAGLAFAGLFKMVRQAVIQPDQVVVVNCSGHTFPVEKQVLGDEIAHSVDVTPAAHRTIPQEGLLAALEHLDRRITRVVIIEDSQDASRLMRRILAAHGNYQITEARDGAEGIRAAEQVHPDLIVLDLMLPGMDGFQVLDQLKTDEALRDVPVIVVTAKDLTSAEHERLVGQVESLLQKGSFIDEQFLQGLVDELG
jgi:threonine synthase